jgi:hypothetical protein
MPTNEFYLFLCEVILKDRFPLNQHVSYRVILWPPGDADVVAQTLAPPLGRTGQWR